MALALFGGYGALGGSDSILRWWTYDAEEFELFERLDGQGNIYLELARIFPGTLNASSANLQFPDHRSLEVFAQKIQVRDLADPHARSHSPRGLAETRLWALAPATVEVDRANLSLYGTLHQRVDYFEYVKHFIHMGRFSDDSDLRYQTQMGLNGLAKLRGGGWAEIHGVSDVLFMRDSVQSNDWRISSWIVREFSTVEGEERFFAEVLHEIVPDPEQARRAHVSEHDQWVLDFFTDDEFQAPHEFFTLQSNDRHPGVSVTDFDNDGDDDLFLSTRWGRAQLFQNLGDGTFREMAAEVGLDIDGFADASIFADFDNDGDQDVFVGRSLRRSQYFINEGGQYVDATHTRIDVPLPFLVSSMNAVDYDLDGLLDVYLSTYAGITMHRRYFTHYLNDEGPGVLPEFLSPEEDARLEEIMDASFHLYLNRTGPPNVLLHNDGEGRFSLVENEVVKLWSSTYQTTWADIDLDGDPDFYAANDFDTNHMVRNDGDGVFTDITERTGTADVGFGMGCTFGDYDNDGDHDLYVANMFSKAGQRIVSLVPQVDPAFVAMAKGNTFFRNNGESFQIVSGVSPPSLLVELGG